MLDVMLVTAPNSCGRETAALPDNNVLMLRHSAAHRSDPAVTAKLNIARSINLSKQAIQLKQSAQELIEDSRRLRELAKAKAHPIISGDNNDLISGSSGLRSLNSAIHQVLATAE